MKRTIAFFVSFFLFLPILVQGQVFSSTGVKAGMTISNQSIRFSPVDYYEMDTKSVVRPGFALFFEALQGEKFSLQFDIGYLGKGCKTSTESISIDHLNDDRLIINTGDLTRSSFSYYSISPMLRYRSPIGVLTGYFLLGPRFEILSSYQTDSDYPLESQNDFILGLTGALGIEMELNKFNVFAEFQYQPDLSPVTNEGAILINNNISFINLGIRHIMGE